MAYEQVIFEQLPNRAGHVERFMDVPETPEQAYIVLYQQKDGSWWNGRETEDEAKAIEVAAKWEKQGTVVKIVLAHKVMPEVAPVQQEERSTAPTSEMLQEAISKSIYDDGKMVSVQAVYQQLPKEVEIPRRFGQVVEGEIRSAYPNAVYHGGGVFQIKK